MKVHHQPGSSSKWLGSMQNPLTEQVKLGPAISLPLDQLEARDLAFGLPLRPGEIQACTNGCFISSESSGKASQLGGLALQCTFHPRCQLGGRSVSDQAKEGLGEVVALAEFIVSLS